MHLGGFAAPHKAYLAVDFFFILSGFVLTGAYLRKAEAAGFFRAYMIDRIARLYPLHLATLSVLLVINVVFWLSTGQALESGWSYGDGHAYTFVLNLLMLQNVGLTTDSSWNAPSWSISVEFVANIGLGLLFLYLATKRRAWPWLLTVALLCYVILFNAYGHLGVFTETAFGFANTGLLRGIAGIALGVVAWQVFDAVKANGSGLEPFAAMGCIIAFLGLILFAPSLANLDFLVIPLMLGGVLLTALSEGRAPIQKGWMRSTLLALGASSYAVYLIHWPIITFIRYQLVYAWGWPIDIADPATTAAILLTIALLAFPVHYYFELPMQKKVRSWFSR